MSALMGSGCVTKQSAGLPACIRVLLLRAELNIRSSHGSGREPFRTPIRLTIEVPIAATWWLSKKKGKEAYIVPTVKDGRVRYDIRHDAAGPQGDEDGTRVGRGAVSIADGTPISADYIKSEGSAGRLGAHLIAIVAEGKRSRLYLPNRGAHSGGERSSTSGRPDQELPYDPRNI